jgi:hypothetical protein
MTMQRQLVFAVLLISCLGLSVGCSRDSRADDANAIFVSGRIEGDVTNVAPKLSGRVRKVALNAILWLAKVPVPANGVECTVTDEDILQNLDPKNKPRARENPAKAEPFISPVLPGK